MVVFRHARILGHESLHVPPPIFNQCGIVKDSGAGLSEQCKFELSVSVTGHFAVTHRNSAVVAFVVALPNICLGNCDSYCVKGILIPLFVQSWPMEPSVNHFTPPPRRSLVPATHPQSAVNAARMRRDTVVCQRGLQPWPSSCDPDITDFEHSTWVVDCQVDYT